MSRPLNDTTVEAAQKEVHRRLLREEKLKRIEDEEMRRLAAMGWQPRRGGSSAHAGSSVHDAADAIEVTERKRRAFAQEAQKRAQQRANDRELSADEIIKVPPIIPHRGPPTPEERLPGILRQFNAIEKVFRDGGQTRAADMWRHYLDRVGDAVVISPPDIRAYDVMKDAEGAIEQYFIDWMTRPLFEEKLDATTRIPQKRIVKSDLERIGPELLAMKDGETKFARSNWDRKLRYPSYLDMRRGGEQEDARDLYGFLGEAQLSGNGGFRFARRGDAIEFDGTVVHGFNEPFNFETGRDFPDPSFPARFVIGADGELLQKRGLAKEFDMRSQWLRRVQGRLKIDSNGRLVLDGNPVWNDVDPSERWP